ncbi:MAG: CerR family C-terminal domain-containing protein [Planctomycetes bacterium]|nr:CerR family C-terminal domain-containing protein [Planctomycetota bacterium]
MPADPDPTRDRLIAAAEEEFAAVGFGRTTVQAICRRAGANIAAVNYHFGGKERLYREVLERAREALERDFPLPPEQGEAATRLHDFIAAILTRLLTSGPHAWMARVWAQELVNPSPLMDVVVPTMIAPTHRRLRGIVADLTGRSPDDALVWRLTASVVGQCLFYRIAQPVIQRLGRPLPTTPEDIALLAQAITRFSLAGIRAEAQA